LSVLENVFTAERRSAAIPSRAVINRRGESAGYGTMRQTLAIRAHSPEQLITSLSGGNQQKVMLARALVSEARILLLNEPTRGVDVGTKLEIHELIRRLAEQGKAVFVSSSDVPELVAISDRCLVLGKGEIRAVLPHARLSEESIVAAAVGHTAEPAAAAEA
jgi:ABC-type sugar transport system ATPase subunit